MKVKEEKLRLEESRLRGLIDRCHFVVITDADAIPSCQRSKKDSKRASKQGRKSLKSELDY